MGRRNSQDDEEKKTEQIDDENISLLSKKPNSDESSLTKRYQRLNQIKITPLSVYLPAGILDYFDFESLSRSDDVRDETRDYMRDEMIIKSYSGHSCLSES